MQMENKVSGRLLEALRCFPEGKKVTWETGISGEEWMELFQMAVQHRVLSAETKALPQLHSKVCEIYRVIESQNILSWKGPTAITKSNSWLHTRYSS